MKITRRGLFGLLASAGALVMVPFAKVKAKFARGPAFVRHPCGLLFLSDEAGGYCEIGPPMEYGQPPSVPIYSDVQSRPDAAALFDHPRSTGPVRPIDFSSREPNKGYTDMCLIPEETRRLWSGS